MYDHETTHEDKKLIEGKITFHNEEAFKRSSVLSIYRFLNKHHGNALECIKETEWVPPLNRQKFLIFHMQPALWTAKYSIQNDNLHFDVEEEHPENPFAAQDYDPHAKSGQLLEPTRPEIHWIFAEPGPHFINAYWIKSEKPQEHSFIAYENHPVAIQKLEWLTQNLAKQFKNEKRIFEAKFSIDGKVQKTF